MLKLETERLILHPYEETDLSEYHKLLSDKRNMYFLNDIATGTPEESLASLTQAIALNGQENARRFCVALKETNKLIGGVGYDIKTVTPAGKIADPHGLVYNAGISKQRLHNRSRKEGFGVRVFKRQLHTGGYGLLQR